MTDYKTEYSKDKNINTLDKGSYTDCGDGTPAKQVYICNASDIGGGGAANIDFDLADGSVSAIKAIYKTINGIALGDDTTDYEKATIIGISVTGNSSGNQVKYQIDGKLEDSSFNFPLNDPLYLGSGGIITNIFPTVGFRTRLGTSLGIGAIEIQIEEPIIL